MSLIAYFPLAYGLLTGKYRRGEQAPAGSRLGAGEPGAPAGERRLGPDRGAAGLRRRARRRHPRRGARRAGGAAGGGQRDRRRDPARAGRGQRAGRALAADGRGPRGAGRGQRAPRRGHDARLVHPRVEPPVTGPWPRPTRRRRRCFTLRASGRRLRHLGWHEGPVPPAGPHPTKGGEHGHHTGSGARDPASPSGRPRSTNASCIDVRHPAEPHRGQRPAPRARRRRRPTRSSASGSRTRSSCCTWAWPGRSPPATAAAGSPTTT